MMINEFGKTMKQLSKELKRALNALASQDAGDFLSMREKIALLQPSAQRPPQQRIAKTQTPVKSISQRKIVLLDDGQLHTACIDYAVDAYRRQGKDVQIELIVHGQRTAHSLAAIEQHIRDCGVTLKSTRMPINDLQKVAEYLRNESGLFYLVATTANEMATQMVEQLMPLSIDRLHIPVVLIAQNRVDSLNRRSAA